MKKKRKSTVMHGLYESWSTQQKEQQEQQQLHEKYKVENPDVKIVEKRNVLQYLVRFGKLIANILLFTLASIGLVCICYPETRQAFLVVLDMVKDQLYSFF